MPKGWFDAFRENGGPTWYGENRTPVFTDLETATIVVVFGVIYLTFIIVFPGVRREKLVSFLTVTLNLVTGAVLLVCIHHPCWEVGKVKVLAPYKAFSNERFEGVVGLKIGLQAINVTLTGHPFNHSDQAFRYNERFAFTEVRSMQQHLRKGLTQGLPYPMLTVIQYLSVDQAGFNWGRQYRLAGYYTACLLWLCFALWILLILFMCLVPHVYSTCLLTLGATMCLSVLVYALARPLGLVIPFEPYGNSASMTHHLDSQPIVIPTAASLHDINAHSRHSRAAPLRHLRDAAASTTDVLTQKIESHHQLYLLAPAFNWCFWLTLTCGLLCLSLAIVFWICEKKTGYKFATFLQVDIEDVAATVQNETNIFQPSTPEPQSVISFDQIGLQQRKKSADLAENNRTVSFYKPLESSSTKLSNGHYQLSSMPEQSHAVSTTVPVNGKHPGRSAQKGDMVLNSLGVRDTSFTQPVTPQQLDGEPIGVPYSRGSPTAKVSGPQVYGQQINPAFDPDEPQAQDVLQRMTQHATAHDQHHHHHRHHHHHDEPDGGYSQSHPTPGSGPTGGSPSAVKSPDRYRSAAADEIMNRGSAAQADNGRGVDIGSVESSKQNGDMNYDDQTYPYWAEETSVMKSTAAVRPTRYISKSSDAGGHPPSVVPSEAINAIHVQPELTPMRQHESTKHRSRRHEQYQQQRHKSLDSKARSHAQGVNESSTSAHATVGMTAFEKAPATFYLPDEEHHRIRYTSHPPQSLPPGNQPQPKQRKQSTSQEVAGPSYRTLPADDTTEKIDTSQPATRASGPAANDGPTHSATVYVSKNTDYTEKNLSKIIDKLSKVLDNHV